MGLRRYNLRSKNPEDQSRNRLDASFSGGAEVLLRVLIAYVTWKNFIMCIFLSLLLDFSGS